MKVHKIAVIGAVLLCAGLITSLVTFTPTVLAETSTTTQQTNNDQLTTDSESSDVTFALDLDQQSDIAKFQFGGNLLAFGSRLQLDQTTSTGLFFAAGSELELGTSSDYSFIAGAAVSYAGTTERDLFALASTLDITSLAQIGGDVYIAGNVVSVSANLNGDLSVAAAELTLRDVHIAGNLNLSVDRINFEGEVIIDGTFVYNEDAVISGNYEAVTTSPYTVTKPSQASIIAATLYSKLLSIASLFIVTIILFALFPTLYQKLTAQSNARTLATNLTSGLAVLVVVPLVCLFALCTVVAAPLAVIMAVFYVIFIYLAQGVTGTWLGHLILTKLFKRSSNRFIESLIGIVLLGLLSLVPFLGWITGFLSLLFGLGFVILVLYQACTMRLNAVKPSKTHSAK